MNKELIVLDTEPYKQTMRSDAWSLYSTDWNPIHGFYEPYFFLCIRKTLEALGYQCLIKEFDKIDKSKTWFINLVPRGGWSKDQESVFACFPEEWVRELVHGNAYLIINNENEYYTTPLIELLYNEINKESCGIPPNKMFLLSAAASIHEIHKEYCDQHGIKDRVKIIYSPHMNVLFHDGNLDFLETFQNLEKQKKYNILNREFRWHRPIFVSMLANAGILDQGYVSLGAPSHTVNDVKRYGTWKNYLEHHIGQIQHAYSEPIHSHVFEQIRSGFEIIHDKIPICLDKTEFDTNYAPWQYIPLEQMRSSYFHITSCTYFFGFEEKSAGWHEKEWKPMLVKQPFLILGRPGMLKLMRKFGFLTFSRWIDESYDEITDDWLRLDALLKETQRLCQIPNDQWDKIFDEMQNVLEYNHEVLRNRKWDLFFFGGDLKNLVCYL